MNSIMLLLVYNYQDIWVFDDEKTGLIREAFISGIDIMLNRLTENIENSDKGVILLFSENPFPGFQTRLVWERDEYGGNWYYSELHKIEGWLCPALFKYFETAPKEIYAQVKEKKE